MKTHIKPGILLLLLLVGFVCKTKAGVVSWTDTLKGSSIAASANYTVHEDVFDSTSSTWNSTFHTKNNWSLISFSLDNFNSKCVGSSFTVTLVVSVHYLDSNRTAHDTLHTFQINYNPALGANYKDKDLFRIQGAVHTRVTVVSVTASGISLATIQAKLQLETTLLVERYYYFATNTTTSSLSSSYLSVSGDLEVTWNVIVGAETYDLEWTYVNDYDGTITSGSPNYLSASAIFYDFPNNSTRVRVEGTSFNIPIVYEHGYLLYRVRGVGKSGTNYTENVPMAWSSVSDKGAVSGFTSGHKFAIDASKTHEGDKKNWQLAMTFAEQGKFKGVVSYLDGSQRKRQIVTRLNSIQKTMIGETIYDSAGRAAIDVLPAPTNSSKFKFYSNFNLNTSGSPYSNKDFGAVMGSCAPVSGKMDTTAGASKYYSHTNPDSSLQQAFLPDAKYYPFTQTQYTTDNTGRLQAKSGLGADLVIGSGHETKYFYGTPYQEELDRLFANEVGFNSHYKKEMIVDPNGQIAVTYKDAKGNVIATALAGDGASNLTAIPSASSNSITVDLLSNNEISTDSTAIVSRYTMIVSSAGTHSFTYAMGGSKTSTMNCRSVSTCHKCKYNLSITITDACGTTMYCLNKSIGTIDTNSVTCSDTGARFNSNHNLPGPISIYLPVGSYTLTKSLAVDMVAIDTMVNKYMNDPRDTCVHKLQYFIDREMANIDTTNCNIGCADCKSKLGTYDEYSDPAGQFYLTPAQYKQLLTNCDAGCGKDTLTDPCDIAYQSMLMDVSPSGQYGQYIDTLTGIINPSVYPLSVYNTTSNKLPKGSSSNWKFPSGNYVEASGAPSYIIIAPDGTPAHDMSHEEALDNGAIGVRPQYLSNLSDFLANWQASWAQALVYYHPEYGYVAWCNSIGQSNIYDEQLMATKTYAEAYGDGFLGSTNIPVTSTNDTAAIDDVVKNDPYFKTGGVGHGQESTMDTAMKYYAKLGGTTLNIFQFAHLSAICPNAVTSSEVSTCLASPYFAASGSTTIEKDAEWQMFRSLYISLKQKYEYYKRSADAIQGGYYNGCIGNKDFDPTLNQFEPPPAPAGTGYFDSHQPCSIYTAALYQNKVIRYPSINDMVKTGVNLYDDPGTVMPYVQAYTNNGLANTCGQCPNEELLQSLLNDMVGQEKLTDVDTLDNFVEFSLSMRQAISGSDSSQKYIWTPVSYSPTSLLVKISQDTGSLCCVLTFTVEGDTVIWDSIKSICCLHTVPSSSPLQFTFLATMNDGRKVTITCQAPCLNLGCSPPLTCYASDQAKALLNLFNALYINNKWTTTTSLGSNPYLMMMTPLIKSSISSPHANLEWLVTAYGTDSLIVGFGNSDTAASCTFRFKLPSGVHWSDNLDFESILPDPAYLDGTGSSHHFIITAHKPDGTVVKCQGSNTCFVIGMCGNPDQACTNQMQTGDTIRRDLLVLFDSMARHHVFYNYPSSLNLETFPAFSAPLSAAIGGSSRTWTSSIDSTVHFYGRIHNGTCTDSFSLYIADMSFNFKNIVGFTNLVAIPRTYTNSLSDSFSLTALTTFGTNVTVQGKISLSTDSPAAPCFQIANCPLCPYSSIVYTPPGASVPISPPVVSSCSNALCTQQFVSPIIPYKNTCVTNLKNIANRNALDRYNYYVDSFKKAIRQVFINQCLAAIDTFNVTFTEKEFHYTLYYYDQANKLIKTVPPAGVVPITGGTLANVNAYRKNNSLTRIYTAHTLYTLYHYNSLDELRFQKTPDAGNDSFYYDVLGRMVASQNARQVSSPIRYSYTIYDPQGRIKEVGEVLNTDLSESIARDSGAWASWIGTGTRREITKTYYDIPKNSTTNGYFAGGQQCLRTRVATMTYQDVAGASYDYATHFSYDVHGNVSDLVQEYPLLHVMGQDLKRISYDYDLVSGKVNFVYYQSGKADRLIHKYEYDADNRLTNVYTSRDSLVWENDATQFYFEHGPLGREELGDNKVQGVDYAYSIQGWIKGVNSNTLSARTDMGNDGYTISKPYGKLHQKVARDVFGYSLSYYQNDYLAITKNAKFEAKLTSSGLDAASPGLFNGNIRHMVTAIGKLMPTGLALGTAYKYDQLNRILSMDAFSNVDSSTNAWQSGTTPLNDYACRYRYDENGNITGLLRKSTTAGGRLLSMDSLTYHYQSGTNRLLYVHDTVRATNYKTDIDDEPTGNYGYDAIGNLKKDSAEQIATINWTAYGKIKSIIRTTGSSKPNLLFYYGPDGNRIAKIAQYGTDPAKWHYTYYVHDATGNVMAIYTRTIHEKRAPGAADIPACLAELKSNTGSSYFANTFAGPAYCGNSTVVHNLETAMIHQGTSMTFLHTDYNSDWYAQNDTNARNLVLTTGNISNANLVKYFQDSNAIRLTTYIYSLPGSTSVTTDLTSNFVSGSCFSFLVAIDNASLAVGGATHFLQWEYTHASLGTYPTGAGAQSTAATNVCGTVSSASLTSDILTYNALGSIYSSILPTATASFGGGLSSALYTYFTSGSVTSSDLASLRSWLKSQSDIIDILYYESHSIVDTPVYGETDSTLLAIAAANSPCTLLPFITAISTWDNAFANVIKADRTVSQFMSDVSTYAGSTAYREMLVAIYGSAGAYKDSLKLAELDLYGSKRIGLINADTTLAWMDYDGTLDATSGKGTATTIYYSYNQATPTANFNRILGHKRYELSNHLGNVLAVISDKKICNPPAGYDTALYYTADVVTAQDYYPFGSPMPGRQYTMDSSDITVDTCITCGRLKNLLKAYGGTLFDSTALKTYLNDSVPSLFLQSSAKNWLTILRGCSLLKEYYHFIDDHYGFFDANNPPTLIFGKGDITYEAWVRMSDTGGMRGIMGTTYYDFSYFASNGFAMGLDNARPYIILDDVANEVGVYANTYISLNAWHHIVATRHGNTWTNWKIYVDGSAVTTSHMAGTNTTLFTGNTDSIDNGPLLIGDIGLNATKYPFKGDMMQARVYRRAISSTEVSASYNGGCGAPPTNSDSMVLWDPLNDGWYPYSPGYPFSRGWHAHNLAAGDSDEYVNWSGSQDSLWRRIIDTVCLNPTQKAICKSISVGNHAYRYGFNGKEKDDETYGEGDEYDYGMRIYDARIGKFFSVDLLTKKYAWYSPYQFSGDNPIKFIDFDGLEPANNPVTPGPNEMKAMNEVDMIATDAGLNDYAKNLWTAVTNDLKGSTTCYPEDNTYVTDTKGDPGNNFNMYTGNCQFFNVDESNSKDIPNYEAFVVDKLLHNFVAGVGPENTVFPTNGVISSKFLNSPLVASAIQDFNNGQDVTNKQYSFGGPELLNDALLQNQSLFTITGLAGSVSITITKQDQGLAISIFNVTSLTSGAYTAKMSKGTENWPKSYVRDPGQRTPYGNISQTFNLFIPNSQ